MTTRRESNLRTTALMEDLRLAYRDGRLVPGEMILSLRELGARYKLSTGTVATALRQLISEGVLHHKPRVGTFAGQAGTVAHRAPHQFNQTRRVVWHGHNGKFAEAPTPPEATANAGCIVAVSMPDQSFFDRAMDLLFRHTESAGLSLVCSLVRPGQNAALKLPPHENSPVGFVIFSYALASLARSLVHEGWRVVVVGTPPIDVVPEVPCIHGDNARGGYMVVRHLVDLGHRHIALAPASSFDHTTRKLGHQMALDEAARGGIQVRISPIPDEELAAWHDNPRLAAEFFRQPDAPTALIAWNDHEAANLVATLSRADVKIPEEVSIMGYDALPEGERLHPSLTTVDHGINQQLHAALELLTSSNPLPSAHAVVVTPSLIVRESTAAPRMSTNVANA